MKTITLAEALRSGKDFFMSYPGMKEEAKYSKDKIKEYEFSAEAILHAECQIIEEPREIWVWEYSITGNLGGSFFKDKNNCIKYGDGTVGRPVKFREVLDE